MRTNQYHLLATRRFLPLFITQFFGALNDNLFKNGMVMLITYRIAIAEGLDAGIWVTLAGGVFILPFFLFSATAGELADKLEKSQLIRIIKMVEVALMLLAGIGFLTNTVWLLMLILFGMGSHSTFFGPLKYAILPDHLEEQELIGGNGLIEAGTFLAILLGTIIGGVAILEEGGDRLVSLLAVAVALLGWWASRFIPPAPAVAGSVRIRANFPAATWEILRFAASERGIFLSILGISWFWLVGATFLSQFPTFTRITLHADQHVVTLFLALFSIGIGVGSLFCNILLKGEITAKYVPVGALAISLFTFDLALTAAGVPPRSGELLTLSAFLAEPRHWRILIDLLLTAFSGGVYAVPLYAILQSRSEIAHRSRVIAANNVVNALFMVVSAVGTVSLLASGWNIPQLFLLMAGANTLVAFYICGLLPDAVLKGLFALIFRLFYRVEVRGMENMPPAGEKLVIVVNHVSFLDPPLLATFLPGKPIFAVNTWIAQRWWLRPFQSVLQMFPVDPTNPLAIKALIKEVRSGKSCVIFPEGRITVTGSLMKIYEGPGMVAEKAQAAILPVRIDGAQYTPFSRLKGIFRQRWFPKITLTILPVQPFVLPEGVSGRDRRRMAALRLHDLMADMVFTTSNWHRTLFEALTDAVAIHGGKRAMLEDIRRQPMNYRGLLTASFALGHQLATLSEPGERVGLLLPNAMGTVATIFGLHALGRVPAMLNYSTGLFNMQAACKAATLRLILTSRVFVEAGKLHEVVEGLALQARILYLEDLRQEITPVDKMVALFAARFPLWFHRRSGATPHDPAVVLFTSGSEGTPKGVVLSHANILANALQLSSRLDFNPTDTVFNAMPLFHSFGLTGGLLMPLLYGVKIFLYPTPLHYRVIPEMVYDVNATILFATDTFLAGYARMAHPYDFYSVRYVFAGAEKVREVTRKAWFEKFGIRILEGYGATETSPVLTVNTPMHAKSGSVGRFLPGIRHRLEEVPGVREGQRLVVTGPNVMLGYLKAEQPGVLQPCSADGWYDTGDIVTLDQQGYLAIVGRAKRFAKIGGEMISLAAVEAMATEVWPQALHAVVAVRDLRKGEQLVLLTTQIGGERQALSDHAKVHGMPELMVPRRIVTVEKIPLLGSGKVDYPAVQAMVERTGGSDT